MRNAWWSDMGTWFLRSAIIASGEAGPAVSYALGQGAPLIAAIWGVFNLERIKGFNEIC